VCVCVRERERERVYLNQCIKEVKMKGNEVEGSDKSKGGEQHNLSSSKDQKKKKKNTNNKKQEAENRQQPFFSRLLKRTRYANFISYHCEMETDTQTMQQFKSSVDSLV